MKRVAGRHLAKGTAAPNALALEPRFLFDAAGVQTAAQTALPDSHPDALPVTHDSLGDPNLLNALAGTPAPATAPQDAAPRRELVVVDPSVANQATLLSDLKPGTETLILQAGRDALVQIAEAVQQHPGFDAVHILSHGSRGELALGSTALTPDTLAEHAAELNTIRTGLAPGADILLYGCDVGAGPEGAAFLGRLAEATGADVAASVDATGSAQRGGNWTLEAATGSIETPVFASARTQAEYKGLLTYSLAGSTGWVPLMGSGTNDPIGDSQAKAADTDLVGDSNHAVLYGAYDDNGTPNNTADDLMAFRVRIDNPTSTSYFGGVAIVGIDANRDGRVDVFLGVDGRNNTQAIRIFDPGTGLNNSPNTTSTQPLPVGWLANNGVYAFTAANYAVRPVTSATDPQWDGTTDFGNDGHADAFVSFKVPIADLATVLAKPSAADRNGVVGPRGTTGIAGFTKDTVVSYVLMTETQPGPLNGDLAGVGANYDKNTTFAQLGVFTAPQTAAAPVAAGLSVDVTDRIGDGNLSAAEDSATVISGTAPATVTAGSWVKVTVTDASSGTVTTYTQITAGHTWSATANLSGLADGTLTVTAELWTTGDGTGARQTGSSGDSTTVLHDRTPPLVGVDSIATAGKPVVSGTSNLPAGSQITVVIDPDNDSGTNNAVTYKTTVQSGGVWSIDLATALAASGALPAGGLTGYARITATGTDAAGNTTTATGQNKPTVNVQTTTSVRPTVTGTWTNVSGDTLAVVIDGTTYTTANGLAISGNTWSVVPSSDLGATTHEVVATVTRGGTQVVDASTGEVIVVTGPSIGIGSAATSNILRPTLTGTSTVTSGTIFVRIDPGNDGDLADAVTYSVSTDASGNWTLNTATATPISGMAPSAGFAGANGVLATATSGGASASATQVLTVSIPTVTVGSIETAISGNVTGVATRILGDSILNAGENTNVTVSGTSTAITGSVLDVVVSDANGNRVATTATVQAGGTWSATGLNLSTLDNGTLTAKATLQGTSFEGTKTVAHDKTPPRIFFSNASVISRQNGSINGTTELAAGSTISIQILNGATSLHTGTATVQAGGTWSYSYPNSLAANGTTVTIVLSSTATDTAGNVAQSATRAHVLDNGKNSAGTTVTVNAIATDNVISLGEFDSGLTITGSTTVTGPTVTLTISDGTTTVTKTAAVSGSTWSTTLTLAEVQSLKNGGLTVYATAANASVEVVGVATPTLSVAPPTLTITDNVPGVANGAVTFTFIFSEAVSGFDASDVTVTNGTKGAFSGSGTTYTLVVTPTSNSAGTVSVAVNDAAAKGTISNRDNIGATATQTYDTTTPPSVTVNAAALATSARPTITGTTTLPAGASVVVTIDPDNNAATNNTLTYSAVVQSNGTWSVDIAATAPTSGTLAAGGLSSFAKVTATATNAYGTSATATALNTPTVDSLITSNTRPTITGTWANIAGDTLAVVINGVTYTEANGKLTINADNTWSLVADTLPGNSYDVQATVTRGGSSVLDVTSSELVVDTTLPAVAFTSAAVTKNPIPTITGTTDLPVGTVLTVVIDPDNNAATTNSITYLTTVQAGGTWSIDTATAVPADGILPPSGLSGLAKVTATGTDAAGNSSTATQVLNVDLDPPALSITSNAKTRDTTPVIAGTTDLPAGSTLTVTIDPNNDGDLTDAQTYTTTVQTGGFWSVEATTALSGSVGVRASGTDAAGNATITTQTLTIDATAPVVAITSTFGDTNGNGWVSAAENKTIAVGGTTTGVPVGSTLTVTITDGTNTVQDTATVNGDGTWSIATLDLTRYGFVDGVVAVTATYREGNDEYRAVSSFQHDQTPPGATLTAGTTAINGPVTVTATFTEAVTGLTASDFATSNNAAVSNLSSSDGGKTWTFTLTPAVTGSAAVWLPASTATDAAGNANTLSAPLLFDVTLPTPDTFAPTLVSVLRPAAAASLTNADSVTFHVAFSEAVTGVDADDFVVKLDGATIAPTVSVNAVAGVPGAYDVTVGGAGITNGNGVLAVGLASTGHAITDTAATPNALADNAVASVSESYTLDNRAPQLAASNGAVVNGSIVTLSYDEALGSMSPATTDYSITTSSGTALSITGVSLNPVDNTVTLTLSRAVAATETVALTYTAASKVQDKAGNPAATFTSLALTNSTPAPDTTAPVIDLAPSDAATLNRTVISTAGAAVSLDDNSTPATLAEASNAVSELRLTIGGLANGTSEKLIFGNPAASGATLNADGSGVGTTTATVGGISVNIQYASGTFTITKADWTPLTATQAQDIVRDLQYRNDAGTITAGDRTVAFAATDSAGNVTATTATVTINVTAGGSSNNAPTISVTTANAAFVEKDGADDAAGAKAILTAANITDLDLSNPKSVAVQITNAKTGDQLLFTDTAKIQGSYSNGTLTLTAVSGQTPTEAEFEAALAAVTFNNTSDTPDTTTRTVAFTVTDASDATSTAATASVTVTATNDTPTLSVTSAGAAFVEKDGADDKSGAKAILTAATITDCDLTNPKSVSVTITNAKTGDELLFTNTSKIQGSYSNGTLTLSAVGGQTPSAADYQAALTVVRFNNTSDSPDTTTRTLEFTVTDVADVTSTAATASVSVAATNEAPTHGTVTADPIGQALAGGTTHSVTVVYDDVDGTIAPASIGTGNITVTGPGGTTLTITDASWNAATSTATYTIAAPGGTWNDADNGTYTVAINANQVKDDTGAAVAADANAKTFTVSLDTTPPGAPALTLLAASDTGASATDRLTANVTPTVRVTLTGTGAVSGDHVGFHLNGTGPIRTVQIAAGDIQAGYVDVAMPDLGADGLKNLGARIIDAAGNPGTPSDLLPVMQDTAGPLLQAASVDGNTLTLRYDDASQLDAVQTAAPTAFTVTVGGASVAVTAVAVNADAKTVTLTLAAIAGHGQEVKVSYADPTTGNDTNAVQDRAGNDAASVIERAVTNNTPVPPPEEPTTPPVPPPVTPVTPVVTPPVTPVTPPVVTPPETPPVTPTPVDPPVVTTPPVTPPVTQPVTPLPTPETTVQPPPPPAPVPPPAPTPVVMTPPTPVAPVPTILSVVQTNPTGTGTGPVVPVPPSPIVSTVSVLAPAPAPAPTIPAPVVAPPPAPTPPAPATPTLGPSPSSSGTPSGTGASSGAANTSLSVGGASRPNGLPPPVALAPQGSATGPTLQVVGTVGDRAVQIGQPNNIPIPAGTFQSTDPQANVTLEATQADGSPLPVWLKFDASSGTFTGNPPPDAQGAVNIKVIARDDQGSQAVTEFRINVGRTSNGDATDGGSQGPNRPPSRTDAPARDDAQPPQGDLPSEAPPDQPAASGRNGQRADAEPAPVGKPAFSTQVGAANGNSLVTEAAALLQSLERMLFG
ncbi:DUF4347 domain-containing protein [Azospirillum sp.]|uniref:DUF4347 domain-containing protein n=1 Tax=Azospirillum sp. TaxID=34012 RepID=UPI003D75A4C5